MILCFRSKFIISGVIKNTLENKFHPTALEDGVTLWSVASKRKNLKSVSPVFKTW